MDKTVFNNIETYYNSRVLEYGHDPKSCDYGHAASQAIKFKVLSEGHNIEGKSILDVGCGFADYYKYLKTKHKEFHYTGIDISEEMVKNAKELNPDLELIYGNFLTFPFDRKFDIVKANGIFYLLGDDAFTLMKEMIKKMFDLAEEAVLFNSLSSWTKDKEGNEFYADPAEIFFFCKTLSPWVTLRHDYHHRDFTIYLYKERNV